jgi:hypothetical protein
MADDEPGEPAGARWVILVDPAWQPATEGDQPPVEAVVGGWFIDEDGETTRFESNSRYEPSQPGSPTDPVDATMQIVVRGDADGTDLLAVMADSVFDVAVNAEGAAIVAPAPDNVPSVLVTTAPAHQERVNAAGWVELTLAQLAEALPDEGVDVLLNPGAQASLRIQASALKAAVDPGR